jgi:hypothetical protein
MSICSWLQAPPQEMGEVTGTNVYVRSGPSTNYYPVTRLARGQEVQIIRRKPGWVSIVPPNSTYSLVSKDKVNLLDSGKAGVINDKRVWAFAGSELSPQRYAKQVALENNHQVVIVGELLDHYKIAPPAGAELWVSADYVRSLNPVTPDPEAAQPEPREITPQPQPEPTETQPQTEPAPRPATVNPVVTPAVALETAETPDVVEPTIDEAVPLRITSNAQMQARIDALESQIATQTAQDVLLRDYSAIIEGYKAIAEQNTDILARRFGKYRMIHLTRLTQRAVALRELQKLEDEIRGIRDTFGKERATPQKAPIITRNYDVIGKLVESFAYSSPVGPRRFRIVDSDGATARTVAYIEIEPTSDLDPKRYLGRHVGVRSKSKRLLEGAVDPTVVHIPAEIVILEQSTTSPPAE